MNTVTIGNITVKSNETLTQIFSLIKGVVIETKPKGRIEVIHRLPFEED